MLTSLARKISLSLLASVWMSGCGGRTLDPDTTEWYGEGGDGDDDTGVGGAEELGGTTSAGGAIGRSGATSKPRAGGSSAGGTYYKTTSTRTYGGAAPDSQGGSGGYYPKSSKGGASGYSSSTGRGGSSGYSSSIPKGGVSGFSNTRGGTSGVGGSTPIVRGGAGGTSFTGNGGTSAISCPIYQCSSDCPFGRWQGVNGCYDCACAPPNVSLSADIISCPSNALTLVTGASLTLLSGNRWWELSFEWTCSALTTNSGAPLTALVIAHVRDAPAILPLEGINTTLYPKDTPAFWQVPMAVLSAAQGSGATVGLTSTDQTFLSIRREDNRLVGGLYLNATIPNGAGVTTVTLTAPFSLEVPRLLI